MPFFYTYNCIQELAQTCEKYETAIRLIYTPTEPIKSKHFLFHNLEEIDTTNEYGVLGRLKTIHYFKLARVWKICFDNATYSSEDIDPAACIFVYENVKR